MQWKELRWFPSLLVRGIKEWRCWWIPEPSFLNQNLMPTKLTCGDQIHQYVQHEKQVTSGWLVECQGAWEHWIIESTLAWRWIDEKWCIEPLTCMLFFTLVCLSQSWVADLLGVVGYVRVTSLWYHCSPKVLIHHSVSFLTLACISYSWVADLLNVIVPVNLNLTWLVIER